MSAWLGRAVLLLGRPGGPAVAAAAPSSCLCLLRGPPRCCCHRRLGSLRGGAEGLLLPRESSPPGRALGTHPKEPMEALNTAQGARDFIYSLHSTERSCLLRELHRFESIAIAQGTDEKKIIEVLSSRTSEQRQQIKQKYKALYNKEIVNIKEAYKRLFDKDLVSDVKSDTSGSLQKILVTVLEATRDETQQVNSELAEQDASDLYKAGEGRWGTEELAFNVVLAKRSYSQLRATFQAYEKVCGKDIEESIKSETSGDLEKAYLTLVSCAKDCPGYFATLLHKSMKGAGTDEETLIRILVTRAESDLPAIKEKYQQMYKKSLAEAVRSDTSGDFRKLLLALLH
ncbi:annexin A13-like isoform X3 [Pogoniulus pusillus]|uniref:annexin A13-like isoform X3 n=1 Tax=Pogoniulus pusillus TaxID=488313 RepID=UPI0030B92665